MNDKIMVTKAAMPTFDEYSNEIKDIFDSHILTNMGEKHKILQKKLLEYLDVKNIELLVNGHMALELSLQALNLCGEVITTPFTFASTTHAIVRNNLEPIFCDINPDTYTIDENKIESLITDRTCAIVPVHVYGNICNIEEIQRIANKYGLKVIYDAAHTFGETYKGIGIGNFGDVSCFSFHATKVFNTIEGGAVCFKDEEVGKILYRLKNFGIKGPEIVDGIGANAKMNEFQAAMGICNLRHIEEEINKRKEIFECYNDNLIDIDGIKLNAIQTGVKFNYAYYPILFEEKQFGFTRNEVFETLARENIYARKYFYPLTNTYECFHGKYNNCELPNAKHVSNRVLTLPIYGDLEIKDVERICDIIKNMKN